MCIETSEVEDLWSNNLNALSTNEVIDLIIESWYACRASEMFGTQCRVFLNSGSWSIYEEKNVWMKTHPFLNVHVLQIQSKLWTLQPMCVYEKSLYNQHKLLKHEDIPKLFPRIWTVQTQHTTFFFVNAKTFTTINIHSKQSFCVISSHH